MKEILELYMEKEKLHKELDALNEEASFVLGCLNRQSLKHISDLAEMTIVIDKVSQMYIEKIHNIGSRLDDNHKRLIALMKGV